MHRFASRHFALAALALSVATLSVHARAQPSDERLDRVLERLAASDARVRDDAQAELTRLLEASDSAIDLGRAIDLARPEARRRVAVALGADDRLLGLAVRLATDGDPDVAGVGRWAIESQLVRWSASAFDEPSTAAFDRPRQSIGLPGSWDARTASRVSLDPSAGGGVAAFDRLDRLGLGPAPVVLDPQVAERMIRRPAPEVRAQRVSGSWTEVLEALTEIHGAAFQVQGYRYPGEVRASDVEGDAAPARAWIHVVARGTTELAPVGADVRRRAGSFIVDWCVDMQREGNIVRQSAAARALAALDWSAAVLWFESRWLRTGDVVALEGLLAAAARGRVAPALQQAASVRSVLRLIDEEAREVAALKKSLDDALAPDTIAGARNAYEAAVAANDERARRFATGLAALAPIAAGAGPNAPGAPLIPVVLEGFDAARPTGRWARLVALEGFGLSSPSAAQAAARALRGERPARSRRQALRALLVALPLRRDATTPRVVLPDPRLLFGESPTGDVAGIGLELGLAGVRAPAGGGGWVKPLLADRATVAELLVWGALLSEGRPAGQAPPDWLTDVVRAALRQEADQNPAAGLGPFVRATLLARGDLEKAFRSLVAWVDPALDAGGREDLGRAALRAGLASPAARRAALANARRALENDRDDAGEVEAAWRDLAAIVGDEAVGTVALETLQQSFIESIEERSKGPAGGTRALREATEAAVAALERARRDDLSEQFAGELRRAATRTDHPLADRFLRVDWPPRRPLPPRDLERLSAPLPPR